MSQSRTAQTPKIGGIVLCGGQSTRMGRPKAWLPFGPELMLQRVVRVLSEVVTPIVVVAAQGQDLPRLPPEVEIVRDEYEALGPLAAIAAGLDALGSRVDAAYVSSCDVPFLNAAFVTRMLAELDDYDLAIPRDGQYHHPLAAVYRTRLLGLVRELIAAGQLRPLFLLERSRTREIDVAELRTADPNLQSLRNINTPEDYEAALRDAGFAPGP
jgi:molybdopterin-guanine dinucleotide biosynthesis protein A